MTAAVVICASPNHERDASISRTLVRILHPFHSDIFELCPKHNHHRLCLHFPLSKNAYSQFLVQLQRS